MALVHHPPVPPRAFPPARTVLVPDRGEFFLRDSGLILRDSGLSAGDGARQAQEGAPAVLMLHGWVGSADLNFGALYEDVVAAGHRVLALDHRGHGRGLRHTAPFRLQDCAADAAAVVRTLGVGPVIVYGYSMGGAIAQLIAREHADIVAGMVLSGTAQHWREPELRRAWRSMPLLGLALALAPVRGWRLALRRSGVPSVPQTAWVHAEMIRHSPAAIAQAGAELGRFDSRPWLGRLSFPTAMVLTSVDDAVPPAKQRELAQATGARVFEAPVRHLEVAAMAGEDAASRYNPVLLQALDWVRASVASGSLVGREP
ncbi:MAG TPA: alpha/beta fold hydrolase [Solirubrobacteraceae bacterium]|nr:alpha/beta fold hydrolase [Solirubrobacteraceae bacterium]